MGAVRHGGSAAVRSMAIRAPSVVAPDRGRTRGSAPPGGHPIRGLANGQLTVPAWATVETVGEFHKETKHYAWASVAGLADFQGEAESRAGSGDGFAPTTSPRRLAVFKFVAERRAFKDGHFEHGRLSWRSLIELWTRRLRKKHA